MSNLALFNKTITDQRTQEYLLQVLGEKKASFVNNITALVSNNKALQECEPLSLMYAGIKATALDLPLDPNLGFAYVIPYNNSKAGTKEAQFQIGYKGFKQLAIRTGKFRVINATDVRDGEIKSRNRLTGDIDFHFIEDEKERMQHDIIGFVSYFELENGFSSTLYMSVQELINHGKRYSQTFGSRYENIRNSSKWTTDFESMALKTVTKLNLSKNAPLSIEMQQAITADQAVIEENGQRYVDSPDVPRATIEDAEVVEQPDPSEAGQEEVKKIQL